MRTKLARAAVVGAAALAAAGFTVLPANAATITFNAQCESGGLRIVCDAFGIAGGTAPYTVRWAPGNVWTLINPTTGDGNCYRGHGYGVTATVTDATGATGTGGTGGNCNPGPWP
jgi:hypothetical protein